MLLKKKIAKKLLFISRMPKLCAILEKKKYDVKEYNNRKYKIK